MRYITVPFCWLDDDNRVLTTDLRINPFSIEAYHAVILDFTDEEETPLSQDITMVVTRSGVTYEIMMEVKGFEILLSNFFKQ